MEFITRLAVIRRHPWHGYAIATVIFVSAFLLRQAFGQQDDPNVPFITFFPAILLASLFGGAQAGIVIAILSGVVANYFFIPPYNEFELSWPWGAVVLVLYTATATVIIATTHYLNKAMDELARERDRTAALFRELQHRVANNMQFVSALLALQARQLGDNPAADMLKHTRARFDSMARVHRYLYDPASLQQPMGEYLEKLCREMIDGSGVRNVVCMVNIPTDLRLDIQKLLTLSLVVTEVITNSLKHAFKEAGSGTISINLERIERNFALTIADDGPGIPEQFAASNSVGLGMRVLEGFANQLGGTFTISGGKGTTARLIFPA